MLKMGTRTSKCFFFFLFLQTIYTSEINAAEDFDHRVPKSEQHEKIFPFSRREPLSKLQFETSLDDSISPTTTLPPTNPAYNPIPTTNPAIGTPITVPGQQPITNPVTTYPNVPTTTSVTNPVVPPATANSAAVPGQSWCVAKSGAPQTVLQSALDYACGAGADCSQIQQGGGCYSPNTLQSHASYAFNSYYQKNPLPTGCDFGGAASLINTNPSTGSCIFPSSSSSQSSPPSTPLASPLSASPLTPTQTPPTSTTPSPDLTGVSGNGTPPPVLNSSYPDPGASSDLGFGSPPPGFNSTASKSIDLRPFMSCIFLATTLVTRKIVLDM